MTPAEFTNNVMSPLPGVDPTSTPYGRLDAALRPLIEDAYRCGLAAGLERLERIQCWSTSTKMTKTDLREWINGEVEKAKEDLR